MFYCNKNIEEFDRYVEYLGFTVSNSISEADYSYVDLEEFIFSDKFSKDNQINFSNHDLAARELCERFNQLLKHFSTYETNNPGKKQFRVLFSEIIEVQSNYNEEIFRWSYYNHRFAASQGQDKEAMNEWHALEKKLDVNQIARFKARRENNIALMMHVFRNHQFFDQILIGGLDPKIRSEIKFGLDVAEEQYLQKLIVDNRSANTCKILDFKLANPTLILLKRFLELKKIRLKGHVVSNSRKLNPNLLLQIRNMFLLLNIQEVAIENCDFAFLINDLDAINLIPIVDTDKPIFAVDLSSPGTPNFSYLLLKDDGFDQIYGFAKNRSGEKAISTFRRSLAAGLVYFLSQRRFAEQIAMNYVDDYFAPLAKSLGKTLKDFSAPLEILSQKLDTLQ
ncbi:MAG: hypothetical protein LW817_01260 [Candidatus Caenarcaniphilales bacterium]|jgi:hypothetical protein|nr:hypothetical protein [Candidatus Caenarcaniphilales bacterium]